jgi:hypothetical protein
MPFPAEKMADYISRLAIRSLQELPGGGCKQDAGLMERKRYLLRFL